MVVRRKKDDWDEDDDMFDDIFESFGFDFDRINERMRKMFERFIKNSENTDIKTYGPFIYGFTYKMGPDGKPYFQEFGNVPNRQFFNPGALPQEEQYREPITDINKDDKRIYVTFELPGVSKEEIDLKVNEENMTITVNNPSRKYYKEIEFDVPVKPETAKAKFQNGILDVSIEIVGKNNPSGKSVKIE
ncbi:archaeal heat shock protein Hsp20 [Caldiplasma sukawensis]